MTGKATVLIRDGTPADIQGCMNLDRNYDTDYVWQVSLHYEVDERSITFKQERLPRTMTVTYPVSEDRLQLSVDRKQCFLVAVERDNHTIGGFLTMRAEIAEQVAIVQDIVVAPALRRQRIGTRLLNAAHQWASEHKLRRLLAETQTKNHPAILFLQQAGLAFCGFNDQYFLNQDIAVYFGHTLR